MSKLTENHFSFKCPMTWDEMGVTDNGRFCGKCRKEVFDLTNCSIDEVIALQRKHGPICGSIRVAQVAAVAVSLSAAACQDGTSHRTTGIVPPRGAAGEAPEKREETKEVVLPGTICPPEQLEKMKGE
jgi:hypothetical protein